MSATKQHRICVEPYRFGGYMIYDENDRTVYVQSDWDFPGLAGSFGWSPSGAGSDDCTDECRFTDGTIDCPTCGTLAGRYIESASEFLDGCNSIVDDPGYFDGSDDE